MIPRRFPLPFTVDACTLKTVRTDCCAINQKITSDRLHSPSFSLHPINLASSPPDPYNRVFGPHRTSYLNDRAIQLALFAKPSWWDGNEEQRTPPHIARKQALIFLSPKRAHVHIKMSRGKSLSILLENTDCNYDQSRSIRF